MTRNKSKYMSKVKPLQRKNTFFILLLCETSDYLHYVWILAIARTNAGPVAIHVCMHAIITTFIISAFLSFLHFTLVFSLATFCSL